MEIGADPEAATLSIVTALPTVTPVAEALGETLNVGTKPTCDSAIALTVPTSFVRITSALMPPVPVVV